MYIVANLRSRRGVTSWCHCAVTRESLIFKFQNKAKQNKAIFTCDFSSAINTYYFGIMPYCMVPSCTNFSKKTKGSDISYHRFPNDQQMRRTWLRWIRRENLSKANSCYACSAHFTPDCFEGPLKELFGMKGKKTLKPGSVPSIFPFLHRKPERELSHKTDKRAQMREKIAKDVYVNRLGRSY